MPQHHVKPAVYAYMHISVSIEHVSIMSEYITYHTFGFIVVRLRKRYIYIYMDMHIYIYGYAYIYICTYLSV